jgi:ABC-type sugar transport system ATPase subunit
LIAGLEALTAGEIRVGERVVNRLAPRDRDIAMVFQDYALYPQMTVYENLAFGLKMRKMPRDEIDRRVRRAETC